MDKPFSEACEKNKRPILEVLKYYIAGNESILEIGSGTGQHARYFCDNLPSINWQTSDLKVNHHGIEQWIKNCQNNNINPPIHLNVANMEEWPSITYQLIFTANTTHIMSWNEVKNLFKLVDSRLQKDGLFFCYGPFNKNGQFTSESNREFDAYLNQRNINMGLRDLKDIEHEANLNQLVLKKIHPMPANNLFLIFIK